MSLSQLLSLSPQVINPQAATYDHVIMIHRSGTRSRPEVRTAEWLILSLDARSVLSTLIHARFGGRLTFHIDSLYPLLYRLVERGWKGAWIE